MPTNAYGDLNPLYPTYHDKDEELDELSRFFKFAYQPSSGYSGTAVFEILDNDQTYMLSLKCDPNTGVSASRELPEREEEISFHCTLPYDTFHDVFWGYTTARTLVMGGGCQIKNWRYKAAYNFGISFDMRSEKWVQYYSSGISIKKMKAPDHHDQRQGVEPSMAVQMIEGIENVNARVKAQRITLYDYKSIGAKLPTSAKETQFMYEWKPSANHRLEEETGNARYPASDAWDMVRLQMDVWRNKQRNLITMNNEKHLSLWNSSMSSLMFWKNDGDDIANKYYHQLRQYRENLTFNPLSVGKSVTEKWKLKLQQSSAKIVSRTVDEYYGYYSQYTRHRIGSISSSIVNNSLRRFTSLLQRHITENEGAHLHLLSTTF